MTRLTESDIKSIPGAADLHNALMKKRLGLNLLELGAKTNNVEVAALMDAIKGTRLASVSISSGEGVLGGFAQSVADIGTRLGFKAKAMTEHDEKGFAEARIWGADFIIYADDDKYLLENSHGQLVADNNPATSKVFVTALECMAGSLKKREILVLGAGIIGRGAIAKLLEIGAFPIIFDVDRKLVSQTASSLGCSFIEEQKLLPEVLHRTNLVFDATPVPNALDLSLCPHDIIVAAPGVPLAWPEKWLYGDSSQKLWHDPLESGTAAMLAAII